jgi:hypothetical protein
MTTGIAVGLVLAVVLGVFWCTYASLFARSPAQKEEELRLLKIARQPWADDRRGDR